MRTAIVKLITWVRDLFRHSHPKVAPVIMDYYTQYFRKQQLIGAIITQGKDRFRVVGYMGRKAEGKAKKYFNRKRTLSPASFGYELIKL